MSDDWYELLCIMPRIRVILIRRMGTITLFRAFLHPELSSVGCGNVLAAQLYALILIGMNIRAGDIDYTVTRGPNVLKILQEFQSTRHSMERPVATLKLVQCHHVSEEDVSKLRESFAEVVVE